MGSKFLRSLALLELEERILNGASLVAAIGVFLPWLSGEWLGLDSYVLYSGFHFYTAFLGLAVFLLHVFILALTIIPMLGYPSPVRKHHREFVRLCAAAQATILVVAALTVLLKITFEFTHTEVRFGIYVSIIGSAVAALYSFLKYQEQRRQDVRELFHHPEEPAVRSQRSDPLVAPPPPPPPPPPLDPEQHRGGIGR